MLAYSVFLKNEGKRRCPNSAQICKAYRDDVIAIRLALQSHIQTKHSLQTNIQAKNSLRTSRFRTTHINLVRFLLGAIFQKQHRVAEHSRLESSFRSDKNKTTEFESSHFISRGYRYRVARVIIDRKSMVTASPLLTVYMLLD